MRKQIASPLQPARHCHAALRAIARRAVALTRRMAKPAPLADDRPLDERVRLSGEW